ncbi:hypothetical protein Sta7437_2398 [Stanieria cyanosphaera PCC 7437]|uniref:Uncharacterized protein n=1 Tax=Stanieria cyanosphaera (strain ATCC 29371 / PCC 7437) TaxID=111780 RepID=K9XW94_STAC7|nr:hypothetical protein [Stanieria cyanosphaera]AFZ35937.1 hypothetical protein Sta7437_2398 [Stanieria cyanosphaera PCC 7437]
MGEAKRRKQSDPSYGKLPLLTSERQKEKHFEQLLDELFSTFDNEIKQLAKADSITEEYDRIKDQLSTWFADKLNNYRNSDRSLIATSLVSFWAEMIQQNRTSPVLLKCMSEVLLPFLPPEQITSLLQIIKDIDAELTNTSI